jgi:hypothetical protein
MSLFWEPDLFSCFLDVTMTIKAFWLWRLRWFQFCIPWQRSKCFRWIRWSSKAGGWADRDLSDSRQIRGSSGCLAEHKFKLGASTIGSKDQAVQTPPMHPVFQVIWQEIDIENTYKSSYRWETLQLLPMFKVFCPGIWVTSTFNNSFWGETVQLLTVYKVICL